MVEAKICWSSRNVNETLQYPTSIISSVNNLRLTRLLLGSIFFTRKIKLHSLDTSPNEKASLAQQLRCANLFGFSQVFSHQPVLPVYMYGMLHSG